MGVGSVVFDGLTSSCFVVVMWKVLMGSLRAGSVVTFGVSQLFSFLKSLIDLRGEGSVQGTLDTSVLCCFWFPFVTRTRQWMYVVATARCLGKRCECRGCYGTGDWKVHADDFSLRTALEGVSCRLEVQRQAVGVPIVQGMSWT